jgi:hypothetical protein
MDYGLKYRLEFESNGNILQLDFLYKNYIPIAGSLINLVGTKSPVKQKWGTENPYEEIRGCNLDISFLSQQNVSVLNFLSPDDNGIQVILKEGANVLFIGFLLQDDFKDTVLEYDHQINLTATDGLGLLKSIDLEEANNMTATKQKNVLVSASLGMASEQYLDIFDLTHTPYGVGSTVILSGTGTLDDGKVCKILAITPTAFYIRLTLDTTFQYINNIILNYDVIYQDVIIGFLFDKLNVAFILGICLKATGLKLDSKVLMNLSNQNVLNEHFLYSTFIRHKDLKNSEKYLDCYNIIKNILQSFGGTLFQQNGYWNFVRQVEFSYSPNVEVTYYDNDFQNIYFIGNYNQTFVIDGNSVLATPDLIPKRKLKYVAEKFEYKNIDNVLLNRDLRTVGALLNQYTTGSGVNLKKIFEYQPLHWYQGFWWNSAGTIQGQNNTNFFIRVVQDYNGNEEDRYICITGGVAFDISAAVVGTWVEVNKGDKVEFGFSIRSTYNGNGPGNQAFYLNNVYQLPLTPRAPASALKSDLNWGIQGYVISRDSGESFLNWKDYGGKSFEIQYDGRLYFYLPHLLPSWSNNKETHIKNITLNYFPLQQGQKDIKGHKHTSTLPVIDVKNNEQIDLSLDDTKSNQIVGTYFLKPNVTDIINKKTEKWNRLNFSEEEKLGKIVTQEKLFLKKDNRLSFEISILDIKKGNYIAPLGLVNWNRYTNLKLLVGSLEIDYSENQAKLILLELCKNGESIIFSKVDNFEYLY